jgi:methylthioribose-1-phosphate isomerase
VKPLYSLALRLQNGRLEILDQTLLPQEELWLAADSPEEMVSHIKRLAVRGAPLIGVAAALSLGVYSVKEKNKTKLLAAADLLREARPTAVNLMHAMDRMKKRIAMDADLSEEAAAIFSEDVLLCDAMAERGARYIQDGDSVLTHCNTGGLATAGVGTALGVIRKAWEQGKKIHVYVDETRPLLQGARLTAWELGKLGIPYTLICDNMAAALMAKGKIQNVFVGSDRIAKNGDVANKIGTYSVAVIANFHKIPFYVVAPSTTLDLKCLTGKDIPIEEREAAEVRSGKSPLEAKVWNPAFDVTPRELIRAIILEDREF